MRKITKTSHKTKHMETIHHLTDHESHKWKTSDIFSGTSNLINRLKIIEEWTEIPFIKRDFYGKHQPHTLLYQHEIMLDLLNDSYHFHQLMIAGDEKLLDLITLTPHQMKLEGEMLGYSPEYLSEEEIINPNQYLSILNNEEVFNEYKEYLDVWLGINLSESTDGSICGLIFPIANIMKRLTEAAWLINHRIGKNRINFLHDQISSFKDTDPLLLNTNQITDPYSVLLDFYGGASLNAHRKDLLDWFKACMTDGQKVEKPSDMLFLYEQLTQLLQATYFITKHKIPFVSNKPYTSTTPSFAHWIKKVDAKYPERGNMQYQPTILSTEELLYPLKSLQPILTIENIKHLRYGLKEWLYFGFTDSDFLGVTDAKYGFELYDQLLKIIELGFVLVVPQGSDAGLTEEEVSHD